jgi:hypothetical protein
MHVRISTSCGSLSYFTFRYKTDAGPALNRQIKPDRKIDVGTIWAMHRTQRCRSKSDNILLFWRLGRVSR